MSVEVRLAALAQPVKKKNDRIEGDMVYAVMVTISLSCGRRRNERWSHLRWIWNVIDASTFVNVLKFFFIMQKQQ